MLKILLPYLTVIPRVRVGYEMVGGNSARSAELAVIISYPTSVTGIIVLLKTPTKYLEFSPTFFVKITDFHVVFTFEQTRTVTIIGDHAGGVGGGGGGQRCFPGKMW